MDLGSKVQQGGNVFQVPGLGHRVSGTGFQVRVRVQVPNLNLILNT
jgi:hypothetical protein